MTSESEAFARTWAELIEALKAQREDGLESLRAWIKAWDDCVQAGETEVFEVAYHQGVRVRAKLPFPDIGGSEGLDQLRKQVGGYRDFASRFRFDVTAFAADENRFAGGGTFRARGRYTGIVFRFPISVLWTLREDKIETLEAYPGAGRALEEIRRTAAVA